MPNISFAKGGAPVVNEDSYYAVQGATLSVPNSQDLGLLDNDYDVDGGFIAVTAATFSSSANPANTITLNTDGSFTYTSASNFTGLDLFEYEVCDDDNPIECATGQIYIEVVDPAVSPPIVAGDYYQMGQGTTLNIPNGSAVGILDNDYNIDGSAISLTPIVLFSTTNPSHSISINGDGSFIFSPPNNFWGTDKFTYEVCDADNLALCASGQITIKVNSGAAPIAGTDNYQMFQGTVLSVPNSSGLMNNDYDTDGGTIWVTAATLSSTLNPNNTITINPDGSFVYTPDVNFLGIDSFEYELCDDDMPVLCSIGRLFINVKNPPQVAPIAIADFYQTTQGTNLIIPSINGILANDYDPDGGPIAATAALQNSSQNPSNTLIIYPNGAFNYNPAPSFSGTDIFQYEICDNDSPVLCATGTIEFLVDPVVGSCVNVQLSVWLEGVYDPTSGEMPTLLNLDPNGDLTHRGVLPGQKKVLFGLPGVEITPPFQPYDDAPWNYSGQEGYSDAAPWYYAPGSLDPMGDPDYAVYHPDVVDWVLVRFRTGDPTTGSSVVEETAAGLLTKDGSIKFFSTCLLDNISSTLVYVQIDHRNHMSVMTPQGIDISDGTLTWDFRAADSYSLSTSFGQKEVPFGSGNWVMYTGDSDQVSDITNSDITGRDNILWSAQNGQFDQYLPSDYNLNADIGGLDKILWSYNNGITNRVPKD